MDMFDGIFFIWSHPSNVRLLRRHLEQYEGIEKTRFMYGSPRAERGHGDCIFAYASVKDNTSFDELCFRISETTGVTDIDAYIFASE